MLRALIKARDWLFPVAARAAGASRARSAPAPSGTHVLITHEGGILCVDPKTGGLVQRGFGDAAPAPAHWTVTDRQVMLRTPFAETPAWNAVPVADGEGVIGLRLVDGNHVCAAPHLGPISYTAAELKAWERMMPVSLADMDRLAAFAAKRWLINDDARPTARHSLAFAPGFKLLFGGRHCGLADLLDMLRQSPEPLLSFVFFHGICTPARALLFEPLIYSTVSGPDYFFEQHDLCVQSLERFGAYDGSYLLVSDRDKSAASVVFDGIDAGRWSCLRQEFPTVEALVRTRREVLRHAALAGYQPILYLDSDVICDSPIEPLLVAAARSERVLIAAEYPGRALAQLPKEAANWFGGFLHEPEDPARARHRCVNSGIFAGRNRDTLDAALSLVARGWTLYRQAHGDRHEAAYDQPFFGHVLQSLDLADIDRASAFVTILNGREPDEGSTQGGLVHFNIGVGRDKTEAMRRYAGRLARSGAYAS